MPIITRIYKDMIYIDVRTLFDNEYRMVAEAFEKLI
jgi:hypothetical protein